jgi:hypothetical protein
MDGHQQEFPDATGILPTIGILNEIWNDPPKPDCSELSEPLWLDWDFDVALESPTEERCESVELLPFRVPVF